MMAAPDISCSPRIGQVVAAVRRLFMRYGYRRTSIDDIAREAGLSKATLYLYFASKEDMFRAMIRQFREVVIDRCDAAEGLAAPIAARVAELIYASHGTALEWFGDAEHIREVKTFAADHPLDDVRGNDRLAFQARLERLLTEAGGTRELDFGRSTTNAREVATVLMFAAHGAKNGSFSGVEDYRSILNVIVRLILGPISTGVIP